MSENKEDLLFDEFGNPLNGSEDSSDSESEVFITNGEPIDSNNDHMDVDEEANNDYANTMQIILPEEKQHYDTLESTFGPGVETIIATTDAKSLNEPIVEPQIEKKFKIEETELPQTTYSKEYLWELSSLPEKVRNVAICGSLHSGKTSLVDMLVEQTHMLNKKSTRNYEPLRYTDNHVLEVKRGLTIKTSVISLLLPDLRDNSMIVNIIDAPGHINFVDELSVAIRLSDVVLLCVDVVEGVTKSLELAIEYALKTRTKMVLVLNKIDRLIIELRLPPLDAYYKLRRTVEQVNSSIENYKKILNLDIHDEELRLSPELNNVCFASNIFNTIFSLTSFTEKYFHRFNLSKSGKISVKSFADKLWGDIYYIENKFTTKADNHISAASSRTFVKFILDPIYKLVTRTLSLDPPLLKEFLKENLGIMLDKPKYKLDPKPLLKEVLSAFFGKPSPSFVHMLQDAPTPQSNALSKLEYLYTGPKSNSDIESHVKACDPSGPLIAYVSKLVDTADSEHFYALVRVLSGTLSESSTVELLGENYNPDYDEDIKQQDIRRCYLSCGRYKVRVPDIKAGSIGLVSGHEIDSFITKTATIYEQSNEEIHYIFKGLDRISEPVFKVAVQPYYPKELNKFADGLKKLNRSYVGCEVKVEEGGEHVILGFGELYMDCLLHDFRKVYGDIEIRVSDPMVKYNETVDDLSSVKLITKSNNGKNNITIIAEPLEEKISQDIKNDVLNILRDSPKKVARMLKERYGWDSFAARSVWCFGPGDKGSSVLCNDIIPGEVDEDSLLGVKGAIMQGFEWATRDGPLCDEPIKDVKFRMIGIELADEDVDRNGAQIIQMVRKACHAAVMIGTPRLLEPIYGIEVMCWNDVVDVLEKLVDRRRGRVLSKETIEGTPMFKIKGLIPVIESVGLETDLRLITRGRAMPQMIFSKWERVPGDPLDETCFVPVLKPAPLNSLSRDFMVKTRKRKGLSEEVSLKKYVDEETWDMLREAELYD